MSATKASSTKSSYLPLIIGVVFGCIALTFIIAAVWPKSKTTPTSTSTCKADNECKDSANPICRDGTCGPECRNITDCTGTDECKNGVCVPPATQPCSPTNCSPPNECQNGVCVPSTTCLNDNGCTPPKICKNGVCGSPECTLNTECGTGSKMCEGNRCIYITPCTTDTDCGLQGRFCRNGACTRACINDAVCPRGSTCRGGICLQTCAVGTICPYLHTCTDGVCVKTPCSATKPCPANPYNPNTTDFNCKSGVCEPACSKTTDCPGSGKDCRFGYCYTQNCPRFEVFDLVCHKTFTSENKVPTSINRDSFLMFEGVVADNNACLDLCEKSRDCQLAFTGKAPTGENTCTLWSRGVNLSTVDRQDQDSQTHTRNY